MVAALCYLLEMPDKVFTVGNQATLVYEQISLLLMEQPRFFVFQEPSWPITEEDPAVCIVERPAGFADTMVSQALEELAVVFSNDYAAFQMLAKILVRQSTRVFLMPIQAALL